MSHYPDPIQLPEYVEQERIERQKTILSSATYGIVIRLSIIALEVVGVIFFGSSALLMDAISSLIDMTSSLILIIGIRIASKPPDAHHPFGHGRLEPLMGLQLGVMLVVVGVGMLLYQSFLIVDEPRTLPIDNRTWIFPFVAMILLEICYRVVMQAAKTKHSPALAADAIHYRIDGITSLFATLALALGAWYPNLSLTFDHIGAILISGLMMGLGGYAAKNNIHQLMDRVPNVAFFERVKLAAMAVEGVKDTEKIRIQLYGPDAHVDIDIEVDPELSVERAHEISQKVRAEIQKKWSAVRDVTVHIEPYYPGDHALLRTPEK